jgi:MATE family multidrug resistance protein
LGLPAGLLLAFPLGMGAGGMWAGLITGLSFSSIFLITRFLKISRQKNAMD